MHMTTRRIALLTTALAIKAFASGDKPGWKVDAEGHAILKDGNPVYIDSNGNELTVETNTISRLNGEAKTHRERAEAAETKLKAYEGIDPEKARGALETVGKLDQKRLIDAGEVDKVRKEIGDNFNTQLAEKDKLIAATNAELNGMRLNTAFSGSKFIADRVAVPAEMFQATFAGNFKVEDGKIVPYERNGNVMYSNTRHSEVASFDEAIERLVETYPHKDSILRAPTNSGSGNGGGGGGRGGKNIMTRSDYDKLPPNDRAALAAKMGTGEVTIVDA